MKKKLLFTLIFLVSMLSFSQENPIAKLSAAPNPFTNSTKVTFNIPQNSTVIFTVKNILGKTVYTQKVKAEKGKNSIPFYKGNLSKGIYIYTIQNKKQFTSKRFVIR